MFLRIKYGRASVVFQDGTKRPTPEHVDDVLVRMERSLNRIWAGKTPAEVDLVEYEASEADDNTAH